MVHFIDIFRCKINRICIKISIIFFSMLEILFYLRFLNNSSKNCLYYKFSIIYAEIQKALNTTLQCAIHIMHGSGQFYFLRNIECNLRQLRIFAKNAASDHCRQSVHVSVKITFYLARIETSDEIVDFSIDVFAVVHKVSRL